MMMRLKIQVFLKKQSYSIDFNTVLANQSPLIPSSNVARRKSSVRDPTAPTHRSSLNIETQMAIRQKRLSQTYNTPPIAKKP
jgi:hypothetical protein